MTESPTQTEKENGPAVQAVFGWHVYRCLSCGDVWRSIITDNRACSYCVDSKTERLVPERNPPQHAAISEEEIQRLNILRGDVKTLNRMHKTAKGTPVQLPNPTIEMDSLNFLMSVIERLSKSPPQPPTPNVLGNFDSFDKALGEAGEREVENCKRSVEKFGGQADEQWLMGVLTGFIHGARYQHGVDTKRLTLTVGGETEEKAE